MLLAKAESADYSLLTRRGRMGRRLRTTSAFESGQTEARGSGTFGRPWPPGPPAAWGGTWTSRAGVDACPTSTGERNHLPFALVGDDSVRVLGNIQPYAVALPDDDYLKRARLQHAWERTLAGVDG